MLFEAQGWSVVEVTSIPMDSTREGESHAQMRGSSRGKYPGR